MTRRIATLLAAPLLALIWLGGVAATVQAQPAAPSPAYVDTDRLDALFVELRNAPDPVAAREAADQIWQVWLAPDDEDLALAMKSAIEARSRVGPRAAIEMLDRIVEKWPDYAEGWNQRATMHFVMGDYDLSLADVDETLAREPRHFGALAGAALIHLRLGNRQKALNAIVDALEYHPYLNERTLFPELLEPQTRI
ncbi:tetratricopeptide repeat protein [Cucumibacter marinus]|uniref:tetratricopeptide repeat protein n=1 Tax=Cucumibacter marinus TaxID=1121252 RepID=UPI000684866F|nr:tetratricopeptide repeat protein [Cucumibacter marinus]